MKLIRYRYLLYTLLACLLSILITACGGPGTTQNPGASPTATSGQTPTAPTKGASTGTPGTAPVSTTLPLPPTLTSCPALGTARAAVTAPLALGTHQNIVYIVKQY